MHASSTSFTHRAVGFFTGVFGVMTIFSGGSVALRLGSALELAGDVIPFVVWFNFAAGFVYVATAIGIWSARSWAGTLATLIAVATALVAIGLAFAVVNGQAYEMRTIGALGFRFVLWAGVAIWLWRGAPK